MNNEKIRILQMVKDGTISPEEAIDLIDALDNASIIEKPEQSEQIMRAELIDVSTPGSPEPHRRGIFGRHRDHRHGHNHGQPNGSGRKARWLHIEVNDGDGKNVNIKVPIGLAKFAGKFIPNEAKKELKDQGIELDLEGLMNELESEGELNLIEVNEGDGKNVRIFTK